MELIVVAMVISSESASARSIRAAKSPRVMRWAVRLIRLNGTIIRDRINHSARASGGNASVSVQM